MFDEVRDEGGVDYSKKNSLDYMPGKKDWKHERKDGDENFMKVQTDPNTRVSRSSRVPIVE